jgi:cob(I)alamin adenosyltransferase
MKIYTRAGDDGTTGLLGAGRVRKSSARVEAYGSVDELNAHLGAARAQDAQRWFEEMLSALQSELFNLGAELATVDPRALEKAPKVGDADVARLEGWIDRLEADLAPLRNFVLPAGTALAAALHVARTVCRRAERRVVALDAEEHLRPEVVRYLNRLSDLLFVMARSANHRAGESEVEWRPGTPGG